MREALGTGTEAGKSEGGTGLVVVYVWRERDFERRLGMERLFGGKQGAGRSAGAEGHRVRELGVVVSCGGGSSERG